jgi:hypothetical protein
VDIHLADAGIPEFYPPPGPFVSRLEPASPDIETGEFEIECRLPYEGDILVKRGTEVEPGDVIGQNRFAPPRLYMLDLNRVTGYDRHLTPEELSEGLMVWIGDAVSVGQPIFRVHRPGIAGFDFVYNSPVRGRITRIETSGLIILREIQDYDGKPHYIDVADSLGIRPSRIRGHLSCRKGDFISRDQSIARDVSRGIFVRSPSAGVVREINTETGTVMVQYDVRPVLLRSYVRGTVTGVKEGSSAVIGVAGSRLAGIIGFGGQNYGTLRTLDDTGSPVLEQGSVLVC